MKKSVLESSQTPLGVQYFFLCAIFQPEIAAFVIQKIATLIMNHAVTINAVIIQAF